jgi:hypothetical protein
MVVATGMASKEGSQTFRHSPRILNLQQVGGFWENERLGVP